MGKGNRKRYTKRVTTRRWVYNIGDPMLVFLMDDFFGCYGIDIVMPKPKFIGGHNSWSRFCLERKIKKGRKADKLRREMMFGDEEAAPSKRTRMRRDDDGVPKAFTVAMAARKRERIEQGLPVECGIHEEKMPARMERSTLVVQSEPKRFVKDEDDEQKGEWVPRYVLYRDVFRRLADEMNTGRIANR